MQPYHKSIFKQVMCWPQASTYLVSPVWEIVCVCVCVCVCVFVRI